MDENTLRLAAVIANIPLLLVCLLGLRIHILTLRNYQQQKSRLTNTSSKSFPYRVQPGALVLGPLWAMANGLPWIALCYLILLPLKLGFFLNIVLFFTGQRLSWRDGKRWLHDRKGYEEENYIFNIIEGDVVSKCT